MWNGRYRGSSGEKGEGGVRSPPAENGNGQVGKQEKVTFNPMGGWIWLEGVVDGRFLLAGISRRTPSHRELDVGVDAGVPSGILRNRVKGTRLRPMDELPASYSKSQRLLLLHVSSRACQYGRIPTPVLYSLLWAVNAR